MTLTHRILVWKHYAEAPATPQKLAARLSKPLTARQVLSTDHIAQKNRQFCSELAQLNTLVGGEIVRARISTLIGHASAGPASFATAASVTYRGAVVARTARCIGQCWCPERSTAHRRHNVFILPALEDPNEVFRPLAHELSHVSAGPNIGHKEQFVKIAKLISFKAPWTSPGPALIARLNDLLVNLDPYPHVAIDKRGRKKQDTRLLKVICGACRYTVRVTQQWIGTRLPSCPYGTQMKLGS